MRPPSPSIHFLLQILLVCLLHRPSFAVKKSYVVYLGAHSHGPELSSVDFNQVTQSHHDFLGSFLGSSNTAKDSIFYSYTRHINGFAATLDEEVAVEIAKHPKVLSVFENRGRKLHTTRSWDFMELEHNGVIQSSSIWKKARFGEGVIIGNLDTGIYIIIIMG
ncbi:subtilisin-like protease SBT5.4 isoform X2 [Glycine max]|uniref:subtilisin-like protease SBT5.4 isoform X2 n=1 Tax=Glycine max TaxID=3847 RepID=UPI001B358066|nr:subtilisin-like protease SBT5.4 isoform X2 [Glycine max]